MADSRQVQRSLCETSSSWVSEECEAGYWAGHHGIAEFQSATHSWRTAWHDSQRELRTLGASLLPTAEPDIMPAQWSLYGTGAAAREYNLPFDEGCSEPWKRSWIQADIDLELKKIRNPITGAGTARLSCPCVRSSRAEEVL